MSVRIRRRADDNDGCGGEADKQSGRSETQFAVRAESNQLQHRVIWFAVDQHQIGFHMAIAMILPSISQGVVVETRRKRIIAGEHPHDRNQVGLERRSMLALDFLFVVALELAGPLNPPHEDPLSALPRYRIL